MNLQTNNSAAHNSDNSIFSISIENIKPRLCKESHGDPYACIDCENVCTFGRRAVELLEKETKGTTKPMTKKQVFDASKKVRAMETYLEVMSAPNPVAYVQSKFNITVERTAKNKIYQWQHNYGTNLALVANRVQEIKDEIAASTPEEESPIERMAKVANEEPVIVRRAKRSDQREKVSKHHLEDLRVEYEEEVTRLDGEIEQYKKEIQKREARIAEIANDVKAIRAVLDIFKAKDAKKKGSDEE